MKNSTGKLKLITVYIFIFTPFLFRQIYPQPGNGYVNPLSYTKGDTINFHISTSAPFFSIQIFKQGDFGQGAYEKLVSVYNNIPGMLHPVPDSVWEKGCGWPVSFSLVIPDNWSSGAYVARFPNQNDSGKSNLVFLVKEKDLGSKSKLVVAMPDFNWIAYNNWGGKNVYNDNSTDYKRAYRVSLNRPFMANGYSEFRAYPLRFLMWLERNGYEYEVASEMDIHKSPEFLKNYQLLVIPGHDEYVSRALRLNIQKFINEGGKYMSLSGNTCWWQVRIEDDFNTLVCYKDRNLDPLYGKIDSLVTVNWFDHPLYYPENIFLGASFRYGGYVNDINHKHFTYSEGFGDFAVFNSHNWIYNGTGLKDGDEFGRHPDDSTCAIVGYEVDGALHNWKNGLPEVTGFDGTPRNYRILGHAPAVGQGGIFNDRYASMGLLYTKNGGAVFNAGTIYWARGVLWDINTQKITKNIIDRFLSDKFPPEITAWEPYKLTVDTVNSEILEINNRELEIEATDTLTFSLKAFDPYGLNLSYKWMIDSVQVSTDSVLSYISTAGKSYRVDAYVFNRKDSSSISWIVKVKGSHPSSVKTPAAKNFSYELSQNYPNPFNPETTIEYSLAYESRLSLKVYNSIGQLVRILEDKTAKPGNYKTKWNIGSLPSGIYFYSLEANALNGKESFSSVRKLVVLK